MMNAPIDVDSIDWSDPVAANKQLKAQLAALEAEQAARFGGRGGGYAEEYPDAEEDMRYEMDMYEDNFDDDIMYENTAPRMEKNRRTRRKKGSKGQTSGTTSSSKRINKTFNDNRCREIDRGNVALLKRLSAIHTGQKSKRSTLERGVAPSRRKKVGSHGINMRRKQDKIAAENRRFAARLQSVKGTKSLSRSSMKKWKRKTKSLSRMTREIPNQRASSATSSWQPVRQSRRGGQPEWN